MPRTTGPGIKGKTTIGGVKHSPGGKSAGGPLAPSGRSALYPGGKATSPRASSVSGIDVAKPKAGKRPSVQPIQRP